MSDEVGRARRGERPLVIAHRGASADVAEHTLAAYIAAFERGVDGIECDVRLTADHHLVCVHDRRANRTSDGTGVISTLELAHLEGLDWGSWKAGQHPDATEHADADPQRRRLLTLRRLLDSLTEQGGEQGGERGGGQGREQGGEQGRELLTLIETKHPTRYGGLVERQLVSVLDQFGLSGGDAPGRPQVRVMSFSRMALGRMHRLAPEVPLVYLIDQATPRLSSEGSLPRGITRVGLDMRIVRRAPETVAAHHDQGHGVYVWTANEPDDIALCADLGVDVIITDRPGEALRLLGE